MSDLNIFSSESASASEQAEQFMANRLASVKLEPSLLTSYQHSVFPTTRAQGAGGLAGLRDALLEIMKVTVPMNGMLALARLILDRGARLEDMDESEVKATIQSLHSRVFSSLSGNDINESLNATLGSISAGHEHIIQPSARYKGGYDVLFTGLPNSGGARVLPTENASVITDPTNDNYERESLNNYKTELSLKVIEACKQILEDLFGKNYTLANAHKRTVVQLPLDHNFERLNTLFKSITGLDVDLGFKNLSKQALSVSDFFSVVLIIDPFDSTYQTWRRYLLAKDTAGTNAESNPRPDNAKLVSEEAFWTSPRVSATFAMNFNKKVCQYICQSNDLDLVYSAINLVVSQWAKSYARPKGLRDSENKKGRGASRRIPRYVVPISKLNDLKKAREESGLHVDKGRTNAEGLTVDPRGRVIYMPAPGQDSLEIASDYEQSMEKLLVRNFAAGVPLLNTSTLNSNVILVANENMKLDEEVRALKNEVNSYSGALLSFSWDYNTILSVGASNSTVTYSDIAGATPPDDLVIADMLGFDFKDEGEKSQFKSFYQFFVENGHVAAGSIGDTEEGDLRTILESLSYNKRAVVDSHAAAFTNRKLIKLFDAYSYYVRLGKLPGLEELLKKTQTEMGLVSTENNQLDRNIYRSVLTEQYGLRPGLLGSMQDRVRDGHIVLALLLAAMYDAKGVVGGNLYQIVADEAGERNVATELPEHPNYFDPWSSKTRLMDFGNVYGYFGGRLFRNMCVALRSLDPKDLLYPKRSNTPDNQLLPSFHSVSYDVMPMAIIFSQYVPNALDYIQKAEQIYENNTPDSSIDVDDIIAPGVQPGAQVFPHQVKAHKVLRRRPKYAVLDVHPGGGKTATGILDILAVSDEMKKQGIRIVPVVIAPDKLCRNWCEDTAMLTKGKWNCIPLTTSTFNEWGPERLSALLKRAPRNTIIAAGINFLKSKPYDVPYGPVRRRVMGGVEFLKQINPNYVLMDESHKAKKFNPEARTTSAIHSAVKDIFTMDGILYARLATGTLIHGVMTDVVGQSALLNPYIYKTPDTSGIDMKADDAPQRIRSKLGKYTGMITLKRKEWAFMLPNPIDTFIQLSLDDGDHPGNRIHAEVYQAVLKETLEELEKAVKTSGRAPSEDSDDDGEEVDEGEEASPDMDFEEGEELASLGSVALQRYLQAVERLVTDPWGHEMFVAAANEAGIKKGDFVPAKIKKVIERLDLHFTVFDYDPVTAGEEGSLNTNRGKILNWTRGMVVQEYAVVKFDGKHYMRRALPLMEGEIPTLKRKLTPPSNLEPSKDPENWKEEAHGKVIIFCRYTDVVDSIYDHLPAKYKSRARRFHGEVGKYGEDKWQNLDDFRNDPNVEIFIANEQAISEGHNLQMGSRIIRVDTPWSPGELEQSSARIFRPDVKAAKVENGKAGDMRREVIYMDWLMTNGTTEVAKVARLMWKTLDKTKFDEKGNTRYEPLNEYSLDKIPMSLEVLRDKNTLEDFMEYFRARGLLGEIERQEFAEMRRTTVASMIDLPIPPIPEDFEELDQFPIMPNQSIPDTKGFGLVPFSDWVLSQPNFGENMDELMNLLPVRTGFGTGVIVGFTVNWTTDSEGKKVPDPKKPVSSVKVRYKANDELVTHRIDNIFVATKANPATYDQFFSTTKPWATETERKRIEDQAQREAERIERESAEREKQRRKAIKDAPKVKAQQEKQNIRKENIQKKRPVNEGIQKVDKVKPVKDGVNKVDKIVPVGKAPEKKAPAPKLKLIPSVHNGFLSIHATNNDPDALDLKKFGFIPHGEFVYCDFKTYPQFEKFIDYIEAKFKVTTDSERRLEAAMDVFEDQAKMGFNVRQALKVASNLPNFFQARKREAQDRKSLKCYPVALHDRLRIMVDTATNPSVSRVVGTTIPGTSATWKAHPGMTVFFGANKRALLAKIKELTKAGFVITNAESVIEAIQDIKQK